jgi:predicted MPP superfamily phosphohydrolase
MRIVHLSDVHLSKQNYNEFKNNVRDSLISDLKNYNNSNYPIDLIIITGDLIDKGGHSLKEIAEFEKFDNPYRIFEQEFIEPIAAQLGISKEKFLFIPGNHDIDENEILWIDEKRLKSSLNKTTINDVLDKNKVEFNYNNIRIQAFKEFEKEYHLDNPNYIYSNNASTYIYKKGEDFTVGFILVNDSWRCSTCRVENAELNYHYFGVEQLYSSINLLKSNTPHLTISLFHHSLEDFIEKDEVERFLLNKKIGFYLYGHHHNTHSSNHINPIGSCYGFRGRATLNNPNEDSDDYKPGYQLYDINIGQSKIEKIHFRRYEHKISRFVPDISFAPNNGVDKNDPHGGKGYIINTSNSAKAMLDSLDQTNFKTN